LRTKGHGVFFFESYAVTQSLFCDSHTTQTSIVTAGYNVIESNVSLLLTGKKDNGYFNILLVAKENQRLHMSDNLSWKHFLCTAAAPLRAYHSSIKFSI
jgi:hypothetical protein